ncbi:hypothetical protein KFE25_005556 [Diacronema lutheri]|uniref:Myotubularin phosphatase domain-containing protein n=3 Tax=Diacronema lutheri TaxID=2081491 RepID=A0A8J5XC49_DIALT|nr:hypothetical protein KFE25_005556 [Diacronema lutheri]
MSDPRRTGTAAGEEEEGEEEGEEGALPIAVAGAPLPPPPLPADVSPEIAALLFARERVLFGPVPCEFATTEFARGSRGDALVTSYRLLLVAARARGEPEPEPALGELAGGYTSLGQGGAHDGILAVGKGVGRGLKEGFEGLFAHPLSGLRDEGMVGLVKGLGKGLFGVAAQPTLGALAAGGAAGAARAAGGACAAAPGRRPGPALVSLPIGNVRTTRIDRRALQLRIKCHDPWKVAIDVSPPRAQPAAGAQLASGAPRATAASAPVERAIGAHSPPAEPSAAAAGGLGAAAGGVERARPEASAACAASGLNGIALAASGLNGIALWVQEGLRALAASPLGSFAFEGGGVDADASRAAAAALGDAVDADLTAMGLWPRGVAGAGAQRADAPAVADAPAAADAPPSPLWRLSAWNASFRACATYPTRVAVPAAVSDAELDEAACFRARGRLPVLCWRPPVAASAHAPALLRSGQPLVGATDGARSRADEALLREAARASAIGLLYILDLRGHLAASANRVRGGGSEDTRLYPFAELQFCDISNAAAVRASYGRLRRLCTERGAVAAAVHGGSGFADGAISGGLGAGGAPTLGGAHGWDNSAAAARPLSHGPWLERVHATGWLAHSSSLLRAATRAAQLLTAGAAVLVHCSDGWDRTSQVVSLTQLLVDARARTVVGFASLVEREWCAMGFRFRDRAGLARSGVDDPSGAAGAAGGGAAACGAAGGGAAGGALDGDVGEAPIFVQWLDAVWQLLAQFPTDFEFDGRLLAHLSDASRSARFCDFLANCALERAALARDALCAPPSVWATVLEPGEDGRLGRPSAAFLNAAYVPHGAMPAASARAPPRAGAGAPPAAPTPAAGAYAGAGAVLYPASAPKRLRLWEGHFLRHVCREL